MVDTAPSITTHFQDKKVLFIDGVFFFPCTDNEIASMMRRISCFHLLYNQAGLLAVASKMGTTWKGKSQDDAYGAVQLLAQYWDGSPQSWPKYVGLRLIPKLLSLLSVMPDWDA